MTSVHSTDHQLEIDLLKEIAEGKLESFTKLYDRFSGVLFSAALQILNDRREAEDALQDVFLQIWDKAALYNPLRGKPLTWAMTLTRNKAIDRVRSSQRRSRLNDEFERESKSSEAAVSANADELIGALERGRLIRAAILQLSKDQREAIELAYFTGLTQNEVALRLGEPLGTVKARIRRGMMKLRLIVADRI